MEPLLVDGDTLEIENLTWYANETDKVLTCTAGGVPKPIFHWEKDNAVRIIKKRETSNCSSGNNQNCISFKLKLTDYPGILI